MKIKKWQLPNPEELEEMEKRLLAKAITSQLQTHPTLPKTFQPPTAGMSPPQIVDLYSQMEREAAAKAFEIEYKMESFPITPTCPLCHKESDGICQQCKTQGQKDADEWMKNQYER